MSGDLAGCRVVVCRAVAQSEELLRLLDEAGATALPFPLIEVVPPADGGAALAAAVDQLTTYDWVLFTSANGVRAVAGALAERSRTWPVGVRVGSVGPATTAACEAEGIPVDLARPGGTGGDLAAEVPPPDGSGWALLPAAELARPELAAGLRAAGWNVDAVVAYRTVRPPVDPAAVEVVEGADAVLFTSPSTVERFLDTAGSGRVPPLVVCIGTSTAGCAAEHGLDVAAVAADQTDRGLVTALASVWDGGRPGRPHPAAGPPA